MRIATLSCFVLVVDFGGDNMIRKLVLWNTKNDKEIPYQVIDYDGDPCDSDSLIAAINHKLEKDYKPLWITSASDIGDSLLIISYVQNSNTEDDKYYRRFNYEFARGRVELIADRQVGNFKSATTYDYELANWIALYGIDPPHDKHKGSVAPTH